MALIFKNLWRRKTRTLLTALGIAVGVAAVIVLTAFGEGLANGFQQLSSASGADLQVGQRDAAMIIFSAVDAEVGDELKQMSGVTEVAGTVVALVQLPESPYFIVMGEDPRGFVIHHYQLAEGQPLTGRRQILLGRMTAEHFKKGVGDTFRINGFGYRVVGIYETGIGFEDGGVVVHIEDAQRAFDKRRQVSFFNIKLRDLDQTEPVRAAIEKRWKDLAVTRSGEPSRQDELLNMYRSMGWFLGVFAVLVGGLGMMNTMLMSVFERTREIGVLRALGWRRRRVIVMILGESLALALVGGLAGLGLGVGLTMLVRLSPAVASMVSGVFAPEMLVQALLIALLLGTLGGFYPAWRAAQLAPVEAMRQESGATVHTGRGMRLVAAWFGGALRNLLRRPIRTVITAIGLGVGVGFIFMLIALTAGVRDEFTRLLSLGQADLIAQQSKVSDASLSLFDERVADRIAVRPEVKSVSRMLFGTTTLPDVQFLLIYGLAPDEAYIDHYNIVEGRRIARPQEIMLGRRTADALKKGVGDKLPIGGSTYRVVGIYENGSAYEDIGAAITLKDAQRLFNKPRKVSFLGIALRYPERAAEIAAAFEAEFPELMVSKSAEHTNRMQDFATLDTMFNALVALTIVVGGIVMTNVMMMSVFERTQEIGVLRALGWRRVRVLRMVLGESLALSLLSALAGIVIGLVLGAGIQLVPLYGSFLKSVYTPGLFAQTVAVALALGALGGLYPAWRAAGLRPIEALRYE